jgi:uncharacterized membrane protein YidH (DUF202 family)
VTLVSALAVLGALVLLFRAGSRWPLDVVGVFCVGALVLYVARALVVGFGVDELHPESVFADGAARVEAGVVEANLLLSLWLVMVTVGVYAASAWNRTVPGLVPVIEAHPSPRRYQRLAATLTLGATVVSLVLLAAYGGFGGLVRASKVDKELAGLFFVRVLPELAAAVAVAAFLDVLRRRGVGRLGSRDRIRMWSAGGMALLNGFWVFAWGSRDTLALVVLAMGAGWFVFGRRARRHPQRTNRGRLWVGLGLAGLVVLGVVVGTRVVRDLATSGDVNASIAEQSTVRQLSVASNAVQYDAFVLAVRDWPAAYEHRGTEDFVSGAAGVVPRRLWPGKPEHVAPGSWFRQVYEPWTRNGWPMGAAGEWYLGFGVGGIVVGGLCSGVLLGLCALALRRSARHPLAFVASLVIGLQVLVLGYHVQTPVRWAGWMLPLFAVAAFLGARRRDSPREAISSGGQGSRVGEAVW